MWPGGYLGLSVCFCSSPRIRGTADSCTRCSNHESFPKELSPNSHASRVSLRRKLCTSPTLSRFRQFGVDHLGKFLHRPEGLADTSRHRRAKGKGYARKGGLKGGR